MKHTYNLLVIWLWLLWGIAISTVPCTAAEELAALITQLEEADLTERDAVTARIIQLAAETHENLERWFDILPRPDDVADKDIAERFRQIRNRIGDRLVEQAARPSTLTIDQPEIALPDLLEQIEQQTGNRMTDLREQWGERASPILVEARFASEPFWPALDKILDQAELWPFRYGEGGALGLRHRPPTTQPRFGQAVYEGPFRIEPLRAQAVRDLVQPTNSGLVLVLEIAWEPRLEPIALLQPTAALRVTTPADDRLPIDHPAEQLVAEPPPGSISTELAIPLKLPDRASIETLSAAGQFVALTPARTADFRFSKLPGSEPVEQNEGGVTVVLERVAERQGLWEFHIRLQLPDDVPGLASHVGWAYQNRTYLLHDDGEQVDHAGFETTSNQPGEIGLAYFFEITEPLDQYVWVYQSPVNIRAIRIDYELENVPLP